MGTEKIKAAAHQVAAILSGKAGILNTLEREHAEVSALMHKVLSAKDPVAVAEDLYTTIRQQLLVHAHAEQDVLYRACEKRAYISSMMPTSRDEHAQLEQLLGQLDSLPVDAPAWMDQFRRLEQTVRHHVEQEENILFERCQDVFENHELRDLDREYDDAKTLAEGLLASAPTLHRTTPAYPPTLH